MLLTEGLNLALPTACAGTELDLAALVETFSPLLFRVAHSVLRNRAEAEDVVQDVFVRVLEHRRDLPAIRELRPWLVRIAWNLALDRRRRVTPDQLDAPQADALRAPAADAGHAIDRQRRLEEVFRVIDKLPASERQALLLSALEELETGEIARIMNKSESAVRGLIFRARNRLHDRLAATHRNSKGERA